MLVNWAKIWDGAGYGGGVNGYCQSLALSLIQRGHEVISLIGGTTFVPAPTPDQTTPCFIRRHDDWLGVKVFEVINSPVMAPSIVQYQNPLGEVSSPELEMEVGRLFNMLGPDVVHFHNIEGFSIGCVDAAKRAGARVVFSLHNYHTICPQVYLMQGHRKVCHDSDGGRNCVDCIETKDPVKERQDRAAAYLQANQPKINEMLAHFGRELKGEWGGFKHEFSWPVRVYKRTRRLVQLRNLIKIEIAKEASESTRPDTTALARPAIPLPGHPVISIADAAEPRPFPEPSRPVASIPDITSEKHKEENSGESGLDDADTGIKSFDHRGQTQHVIAELNGKPRAKRNDTPERRPLLNIALPDPPCLHRLNDYGVRRAAMVKMLSQCDSVLAVSDFVRDKFAAMGVDARVISTMHIGSRIGRVVSQASEMVFDPPEFVTGAAGQRPIRLVFMGYNNTYKGLHVLIEALEMLAPDYLRFLDLSIFALDGQSIEWIFRRIEPRLAKLTFVPGYNYHDIPWMLGGKDLGVVPSVWWDNAPQTVFEFFACRVPVLGAAVGGIPDFVKDGVNGMLFTGNDAWDLARRLAEAVREPWKLSQMRKNVKPPKDIDLHAGELEMVYRGAKMLNEASPT
ncbi:MAG: glycosyltransferase [Pyrinomonadaceae bacterium]|nr:glycosyltransferase [Phycisphaerales bacterium]